jgi:SUMO ligase MMS21 Smc5/6 complex component
MTAQTHLEYISEPTDSMALISKEDIDIINNVFNERNTLDSLHNVNEQIISNLEIKNKLQLSTIKSQAVMLENKDAIIRELEIRNDNSVQYYSKELKKEKNKKISFQTTTGIGIVAIMLILLL